MEIKITSMILGAAIGVVTGTKGKGLVKSVAKGYLAMEEMTKGWTATMREGMRDAVEEARYEREQETAWRERQESQEPQQDVAQVADADGIVSQPGDDPSEAAEKATARPSRAKTAPEKSGD